MSRLLPAALLFSLLWAAGCAGSEGAATPPASPPLFRDVAGEAGLRFPLGQRGRSPLDILETLGHGAALLDADGDGRLDIVLVGPDRCALFRNTTPGPGDPPRFAEVTATSGLRQDGYWMGCAAADFDGDGRTDLLVTGYRTLALYRNEGGRFREVTDAAGLRDTGWSTSAGFADFDGDGWLDLYVARYVRFLPGMVRFCDHAGVPTACGPTTYDPERGRLFRNLGRGSAPDGGCRFEEVTAAAGLDLAQGNALGIAWGDYDDDGHPDLAVANDQLPGDLFRNTGGRFESVGLTSGVAYNAAGQAYAGMGIDWGDIDGDGRPDLIVTTYQHQPRCLYRQDRPGLFTDVAAAAGIAHATVNTLGFGARFLDWDNDGWLDLVLANGHVVDNIAQVQAEVSYRQPTQLFRNRGPERPGAFEEVSHRAGPDIARPIVGRGLCVADLDEDGRLDLLIVDAEGEPLLLRNEVAEAGHWLSIRLAAPPPNRDALGARVRVTAGGRTQTRHMVTDGSYLSASEPRLHFGLGAADRAERVEVRWPDGRVEAWRDVPAGRRLLLRRGEGRP